MKYIKLKTLLLILPAVLFSCKSDKDEAENKEKDTAIPVMTEKAVAEEYPEVFEFTGTVYANREANLGSSMPGKVEEFHYPEGSFVKKGDTLVSLSSEMLTQAEIEYKALKKDMARLKRLLEKESVSQMEFDHLKAKTDAARVKAQMLRNNTSVVAPFSGMIVDYLLEEGENFFFTLAMDPGYSNTSGILRLMQLNPVKVEIQVNEKQLDKINEGQTVKVIPDAFPERSYTGTVDYEKPILSTMTHSSKVEITVPNKNLKLKPGMYVKCIISTQKKSGVFVSMDAIVRQSGTPEEYVYIVEKDSVIRKQQINRIANKGERVIVDSVNAGDTVVIKGKNELKNGSIVKIRNN